MLSVLAQSSQQDDDFLGQIAGLSRTAVCAVMHERRIGLYLTNLQSKCAKQTSGGGLEAIRILGWEFESICAFHQEIGPGRKIKTRNYLKAMFFPATFVSSHIFRATMFSRYAEKTG